MDQIQHKLMIDQRFASVLAANAIAFREGRANGELPPYDVFVDRLFKEIKQLNPDLLLLGIKRMSEDTALSPDGKLHPQMVIDLISNLSNVSPDGSAMHAAVGCAGEGGEMLDCVKKVFIYGKSWTAVDPKTDQSALENLLEEMGDFRFYYQKLLNMLSLTDEDVQAANMAKLRKRYASGHYSDAQALARADKDEPAPRKYIGQPQTEQQRRASDEAK